MSNLAEVVEPERRCAKHVEADEPPYYCADCNVALKFHAKWLKAHEAEQAQQERDAELERRAAQVTLDQEAIRVCTLCDDDGYAGGAQICDHVDRRETNRRGSALVRAELDRLAAERKSRR